MKKVLNTLLLILVFLPALAQEAGVRKRASHVDGATVVCTNGNWTAVTIGKHIYGGKNLAPEVTNRMFQHEYGHYLQGLELGHHYMMLIGIPSLTSKIFRRGNHHFSITETDANRRALKYFSDNYASELSEVGVWDYETNPLPPEGTSVIKVSPFDRIIYEFSPLIGTFVGGIVHSFQNK